MADEQEDPRKEEENAEREEEGSSSEDNEPSRILVVQQGESGKPKIEGIRRYGGERFVLDTWSVPRDLPGILDETEAYLPQDPEADLVLDFVGHPDVSQDLIATCRERGIPVVAPGKGANLEWAHTPPI
jgi:hypothetical protein